MITAQKPVKGVKANKAKPPPTKEDVVHPQPPIRKEFIVYLSVSPGGSAKVEWNRHNLAIHPWTNESTKGQVFSPFFAANRNKKHPLIHAWNVVILNYIPNEDTVPGTDINKFITVTPTPGTTFSLTATPVRH